MSRRIVVLVSGGGTNLQALIDAETSGELKGRIVGVVADRLDIGALERAATANIASAVLLPEDHDRMSYDAALAHLVDEFQPGLVVLAGWRRILSPVFLNRHRTINLHPALPGAFPGLGAIERAFDAWRRDEIETSGVMVHWVPDGGVDDGPVVDSMEVGFESGDDLDRFEARIHAAEHELIVRATNTALAN